MFLLSSLVLWMVGSRMGRSSSDTFDSGGGDQGGQPPAPPYVWHHRLSGGGAHPRHPHHQQRYQHARPPPQLYPPYPTDEVRRFSFICFWSLFLFLSSFSSSFLWCLYNRNSTTLKFEPLCAHLLSLRITAAVPLRPSRCRWWTAKVARVRPLLLGAVRGTPSWRLQARTPVNLRQQ